MKIAYYVDAIIHTLGKSDQGVVTLPQSPLFEPRESEPQIWSLTPALNKQNKNAQTPNPDKILAPSGQWPRAWIWMSHTCLSLSSVYLDFQLC